MTDKKALWIHSDNRYKIDALEIPGYGYRDIINLTCATDTRLFDLLGNVHAMTGAQCECRNNASGWFRIVRYPEAWYLVDWGDKSPENVPRSRLILNPRQDEIAVAMTRKKYTIGGY